MKIKQFKKRRVRTLRYLLAHTVNVYRGCTGGLQGFMGTGVFRLQGLQVTGVPCSSFQGFRVVFTGNLPVPLF